MTRAVIRYEHARIGRKIINFDVDGYGICAWDDCTNDANSLFQIRTHEHPLNVPCDLVDASGGARGRHLWFAFCRETCKTYWGESSGWRANRLAEQHNGKVYGMLPRGMRRSIL